MKFPALPGFSLEGQCYSLPGDFKGDLNVVFVAFQREQYPQIADWRQTLDEMELPGVASYELMVAPYLPYGRQVHYDVSMKQRLGSQRRASMLTLQVNLNDFNRALDIPTVSSIYTFLLDRKGKVLWRGRGPCDRVQRYNLAKTAKSAHKLATPTLAAVR